MMPPLFLKSFRPPVRGTLVVGTRPKATYGKSHRVDRMDKTLTDTEGRELTPLNLITREEREREMQIEPKVGSRCPRQWASRTEKEKEKNR